MINRRAAALCLTTIAASMSSGLAGCGPNVPDTLKIGVVVAQSGTFAARGKDLLRGAELAAEQLNASGFSIAGRKVRVEVVSADDKGEADAAGDATKQLLESGAAAIIGPLNAPQVLKMIPIIAQAGKPHLFTNTQANLHDFGKGNTFRLLANDDLQGRALASFVNETLRAQRVAVVYESSDYGKGLNATFTETLAKAGAKPVWALPIDARAEIPADLGAKMKTDNIDVVLLLSRDPHLKGLYKTLQQASYTDVIVVGTNVIRSKAVAASPVPIKALYATATAIDAAEFLNGKTFLTEFEAKYKESPVWGAHYAYDAVYAVAGAARSAESADSTKLIKTLKTKEPNTRVNHQMRFNEKGEQPYASIAVYQAERGAWQLQMRSSQW
jgi:branched-chain amino acid transport system substrate-binding protein